VSDPLDPSIGRELLDELGFLHVPGPPYAIGTAYVFVALRRAPTLYHFDPERVDYWVTAEGHGAPASIEWESREPPVAAHAWGTIRVVDRINVSNEFATFGGQLLVARVADAKVAVFSSEAPIVALGGHSQERDPGALEIEAFISRLRAAADPRGTFERRLAAMSPGSLYCAYLADELARTKAAERQFDWPDANLPFLERERARLRASNASDWDAGVALAMELSPSDAA
jgi:hypothetical protein